MAEVLAPTLTGPLRRRAEPPGRGDRGGRGADLDRCGRETHRRRDHPAVPGRHRARGGGHRRGDRHAHLAVRPRTAGEPVLPLSPDRPRHRGMAGADRRDGRADRCAGRRARSLGVEIRCGVEVVDVEESADGGDGDRARSTSGEIAFDGALMCWPRWRRPWSTAGWAGRPKIPTGAQIKINMLLDRLPRLASGIDPRIAFAGTMHLEEGFWDLEAAYATTAARQPAGGGAERGVLPFADRSVDHERAPGRDADPVRPAHPGRSVPRRIRRAAGRGPRRPR